MQIRRRTCLAVVGLTACAGLTGCAYNTSRLFDPVEYVETVSSVLISQDRKNIVVMTEQYHYIFDAPVELVATLQGSLHKAVVGMLGVLRVDATGAAAVECHLKTTPTATPEDVQQAITIGFQRSSDGALAWSGILRGMRYAVGDFKTSTPTPVALNKTYQVTVRAQLSSADKASQALKTPLTLAADGALILGAVLLLPFVLVLLDRHKNPRKSSSGG